MYTTVLLILLAHFTFIAVKCFELNFNASITSVNMDIRYYLKFSLS